jgi:hypothetical protein
VAEIPRWPGLNFVGDPLAGDRTLFTASADTRPREMYRDLMLLFFQKNGCEVTPELVREAERRGQEHEDKVLAEFRARGVPTGFRDLFGAKRKKDVERVAKDLVVEKGDLPDLKYNCHRLGLSHHSKHLEWTPEALYLTDEERDALFAMAGESPTSPDEVRVVRKVRESFVEREHRSIHMFANASDEWHCVFLSFEDTADHSGNHWRAGAHVHFVNHTFDPRRLTKKKVWRALQERKYTGMPALHIRFHDENDPGAARLTHPLMYVDGHTGRSKQIAPR